MKTYLLNSNKKLNVAQRYTELIVLLFLSLISALILSSCASTKSLSALPNGSVGHNDEMEESYGIKVESIRLSAANSIIDFRYRIVDPERALKMAGSGEKQGHQHGAASSNDPYLTDRKSGGVLAVPRAAKIGPLRQTPDNGQLKAGRVYFVLFGNANRLVNSGDKVDIQIGNFKMANLTVE